MTNKQAYAGLLERLGKKRVVIVDAYERTSGLVLINPDGPEAAEAISSLLKRVGELEDKAQGLECDYRVALGKLGGLVHFLRAMRRSDAGAIEEYVSRKCAALNSDAPLSIGEEQ